MQVYLIDWQKDSDHEEVEMSFEHEIERVASGLKVMCVMAISLAVAAIVICSVVYGDPDGLTGLFR